MTLREHLKAIRDAHARAHPDSDWCRSGCGTSPYPCLASQHAVAALAMLDAANVTVTFFDYGDLPHEAYRLVPDPEPSA